MAGKGHAPPPASRRNNSSLEDYEQLAQKVLEAGKMRAVGKIPFTAQIDHPSSGINNSKVGSANAAWPSTDTIELGELEPVSGKTWNPVPDGKGAYKNLMGHAAGLGAGMATPNGSALSRCNRNLIRG
jgi:hypothetical protein